MHLCFVTASAGNYFMTELLAALSTTAAEAGHKSILASDAFPDDAEIDAYVAIPHELHATVAPSLYPSQEQCARTIALCTENPGSEWFDGLRHLIPHFGACAAINRASADALTDSGLPCTHVQLGYTPLWDTWRGGPSERPIDVAYLGSADPRRDRALAEFGRWLGRRETRLLRPPAAPKPRARPDYLRGPDKYALLGSAKVLVNLHRSGTSNFEWVRYLEAVANGCVVVSEPSLDAHPLVAGEHLVVADAQSIPMVVEDLLEEPGVMETVRSQAYAFVREQLPMSAAVAALAELAGELPRPPIGRRPGVRSTLPDPPSAHAPSLAIPPERPQRVELRALRLEARQLRREVAELSFRVHTGRDADPEEVLRTDAFAASRPRVSVIITTHNYEREVIEALNSVAASDYGQLEVLVLDDASNDASLDAVARFLRQHPWLAATLMRHPVNRGLSASRNELIDRSRGEYVFVLDADNGVYPTAITRLVAALDADPKATFAYPMIADLDPDGRPLGLLSALPWEPERLRGGNYIDAMAMLRRRDLLELGGYTVDSRLSIWEDFDLWCRCAEAGFRGVLVPSVLAWYRNHQDSMLREAEGSSTSAEWALMRRRFPELLAPA